MRSCVEREEISGGPWSGATTADATSTVGDVNSKATTMIAGAASSERD
jgi:hypothetical protein